MGRGRPRTGRGSAGWVQYVGIQAAALAARDEPPVLHDRAPVHDDGEAPVVGDPARLLVRDPQLEPQAPGADRHGLARVRGRAAAGGTRRRCRPGPSRSTAVDQRGVAGQPVDLRLARVDGHDVVARRARAPASRRATGGPGSRTPRRSRSAALSAAGRGSRRRRAAAAETGPPARRSASRSRSRSCVRRSSPRCPPVAAGLLRDPSTRPLDASDTGHRCVLALQYGRPGPTPREPGIAGGVHVAGL